MCKWSPIIQRTTTFVFPFHSSSSVVIKWQFVLSTDEWNRAGSDTANTLNLTTQRKQSNWKAVEWKSLYEQATTIASGNNTRVIHLFSNFIEPIRCSATIASVANVSTNNKNQFTAYGKVKDTIWVFYAYEIILLFTNGSNHQFYSDFFGLSFNLIFSSSFSNSLFVTLSTSSKTCSTLTTSGI